MNEKELRTQSILYNAATSKNIGYHAIRNSAINYQRIMHLVDTGRAKDISDEPKKNRRPVIITGSGPSFDDQIDTLRRWDGDIICHFSQAVTLMHYGIEPDYIVCLDAICNWEALQCIDWAKTETKIITHPGVWPSLIDNWPNEILIFREGAGAFTKETQKVMYSRLTTTEHNSEYKTNLEAALQNIFHMEPIFRTEVTMFACTPPMQLFAAHIMEYGNVFIYGLDFCYKENKARMTDYTLKDGEWIKNEHWLPDPENPRVTTNNGFKTDPQHLYYKKNFISACRLSMQDVFICNDGAVTDNEIPYCDLNYVIERKGKVRNIPPAQRREQYEQYLAAVGCFCLEYERGNVFIESNNPVIEIADYLRQSNRKYICPICQNVVMSRDDKNHTGEKCELCGNNSLVYANYADIDKNIVKIKRLLEAVK